MEGTPPKMQKMIRTQQIHGEVHFHLSNVSV